MGADVNAKDNDGRTALIGAAMANSNLEVIALLLKGGADINAKGEHDMTALMWAASNNPNPKVLELLLKGGADINAKANYDGRTALMYAVVNNPNPEVVSFLLKNGADAQAKNNYGGIAIEAAGENDKLMGTVAFKQLQEASKAADKRGLFGSIWWFVKNHWIISLIIIGAIIRFAK
ncbi:hypothetical protein FACS1894167_14250 [Synergistales bacterium]|nr:hypothetical protein FACS1894167_14250 [Synergistales bacterium]